MYQTAGSAPSVPHGIGLLQRYLVQGELAPWGPYTHYAAVHPDLGRQASLRLLPAGAPQWELALPRLSTAARVLARVHHANALQIYDLEAVPGVGCGVASEPLVGQRLDAVLAERHCLPPSDAAQITREVARAVLALERAGVACGLLDPSDVLVCAGPLLGQARKGASWVKLLGLGGDAPLWLGEDGVVRLYGPAPPYAAPELGAGHPPDPRTDVFALGSLLYELLSGRKPFPGEDASLRGAPGEAAPCGHAESSASTSLLRLVAHSLREDPAGRYPTVEAFLDRLDAAEANWSFSSAVLQSVRQSAGRH